MAGDTTRRCPTCGNPIQDGDTFCAWCGTRLVAVSANPVSMPVPSVNPTPQHSDDLGNGGAYPPIETTVRAYPPVERVDFVDDVVTPPLPPVADAPVAVPDDDEDPDAPTFVIEPEPVYVLVSLRTGAELTIAPGDVVGKGSSSTVRVAGNRAISRRHLRFEKDEDGRLLIEDQDSTNGTFVGDERLEAYVPTEVADGAVIRLADEEFRLEERVEA